ncbi:MAG: maleylpyruvate isomerase N-terminal domain-containing protein [Chloroflexi bacterium]|nr:maleylpyruvate isomerase N-terminal domain-containing protein [Chloroflexota bacterium]
MYLNALEFLEEEREAFRPFEALGALSDEHLSRPISEAHDWSGRDLIAHVVAWLDDALAAAQELAVGERAEAIERSQREFATRGDEINAEIQTTWRGLPMAEVRRRFRETPGELRGHLTVVPESRWVKHADHLRFFHIYTIEHYEEHLADLEAILDGAS